MACPLSYPDKFHAAARFWQLQPPGTKAFSQENQLLLYALNQQATHGPNTTSRPWGWNTVEATKWQGWKELGKMSTMEAMRLFVKSLDEEQADWWPLLQAAEAKVAAGGSAAAEAAATTRPVPERSVLGLWTQLEMPAADKKPAPRYEAAAAVLGNAVYVLGGNYGGRYLSDVWALDLTSGTWSALQLARPAQAEAEAEAQADGGAAPAPAPVGGGSGSGSGSAFPPTAGHTVTAWNDKLYVLGGHTKVKGSAAMALRVVDPAARTVSEPTAAGSVPPARGGHTATLIGDKVWVFGGEDGSRRPLADVHVLDLASLTWSTPQLSGKAPPPRSASCATVYQDRYLVAFGGGSVATCYSDVHVLDTHTLAWAQPAQAGAKVSPRAGHSGAVLGDIWYIVGGGNNVKGCADLLAADLAALPTSNTLTWHVVTSVAIRDPLSSEGISLVMLPQPRVLVAFGGYNGKYQNAVSLFRAPLGSAALLAGPLASAASAVEERKAAVAAQTGGAAAAPAAAPAAAAPEQVAAPAAKAAKANGAAPAAAASGKAPAAPAAAPQAAQGGKAPAAAAGSAAASADQGAAASSAALVSELRGQVSELRGQLEGARREAESAIRESAAAKEGAAHELALLRKQLATAQGALAEANKALEETRAALGSEQAKVLKLEAQSAELQAKLSSMSELERELDKYRRAAREAAEKEAAAKKSSGLWGYIAGSGSSS
ncbi:hypothetical protein HYH02_011998 [Chlamydomonas schloesseri]|uniref:ACB domain-containing protein n=1 Tax=Chlamydomonas schloesseri TaxID=2026947 RepID=A0A835T9T7_9CHLO|nr:hypothetical protein HYH02_011998 [Chlamydomonas schloesseri]|eukprot:KAG2435000.1 hypothetical protein HYH02_011998 [Chlamydomonas schloesseri]